MINFDIKPVSEELHAKLQHKIDNKTKPLGALGRLEELALQIGCIQNTLTPELKKPIMLVFAGDHGIATEGVSLYPQEVTYQMVLNFLNGGAGINIFTKQHGIDIKVIDAGVKSDFDPHPNLINVKVANGTNSFLNGPAMTKEQCIEALSKGADIVKTINKEGCNIVGFGEMGIGNTSPATMLLSLLCGIPIKKCTGRGTGLDDEKVRKKREILQQALSNNNLVDKDPFVVLQTFGGFEIAMMTGAMLQAAELDMILLIDGFITTSALLTAAKMNTNILEYCIFTHKSGERGHKIMLEHLGADPLLDIGMRLGEGTGAAVAYPIIESAVRFLNEMASFESANVTKSEVSDKSEVS
ncbi:MAG: nicotinate-nucleotide--dimethylbenzimidazole phosphoribosyltransferase [Candidatus Melainabacteria bacterium RIFOXYA12_FULL_32_12]|nr:MAG: nicotinate-nucleotide--dimethylbenzimidazole phosphoribosyltransferase [Candidatus Melainabacteria bacterium RIFOXYA2_FULL_32_9]OGI24820.1 MAG: nicotinate-nucleotide--dimethylbenzimidazole phosphoribosyltransferase [Candidatus Melainabacteria bacterium RIFOXYA12_FULL_32_12]